MLSFCLLAAMVTPHAKAELLVPATKLEPGTPFWVGVKLDMQVGWHTYWANPGDAGLPTSIDWTLPKGWKAGPIRWPVPMDVKMGADTIFGYEGSTILLTQITPSSAAPGAISANVKWLACEKECINESQKVSVIAPSKEANLQIHDQIAAAVAELPRASKEVSALAISNNKKQVLLTVTGAPGEVKFFPFDDSFESAMDRPQANLGDAVRITLQMSTFKSTKPKRVKGVLVVQNGLKWPGSGRAIWIDIPIS